jgi:hypothetical protein
MIAGVAFDVTCKHALQHEADRGEWKEIRTGSSAGINVNTVPTDQSKKKGRSLSIQFVKQTLGVIGAVVAHNFFGIAYVDHVNVLLEFGTGFCLYFLHFLQASARHKRASRFSIVGQHFGKLMHNVPIEVVELIKIVEFNRRHKHVQA